MFVCVRQTFCAKYNSKTNKSNSIELCNQLHPHLNWYVSTFGGNQVTSSAVITLFPEFLKYTQIMASTVWNHTKFYKLKTYYEK